MKTMFLAASALALVAALPASAQILGGGGGLGGTVGGTVGGTLGGAGGRLDGTLGSTIETSRIRTDSVTRTRVKADRKRGSPTLNGDAMLSGRASRGERSIDADAFAHVALGERMRSTRGAVAATRKGLRAVAPTASGVQVFVPKTIAAPVGVPRIAATVYPAYGPSYYYGGPGAVYVDRGYADVYIEQQYQDLESSLAGTGATVRRRGNDLIVALPADVTFAFDKADIQPRFYGTLNAFARTLYEYPGTDVEVIGHTDSVGSDSYNLALSERRGRAVADFLVGRQTEPARLVVEGMGETEPVASNATVEGRAANRRVELIVHPRVG